MLQRNGQITARELAAELEVSEKTARRDLEALGAAGFPVYSQAGRGGGWRLLGEARTDLSGLTADETRALFVVAGASAAATPDVRAALRKLVRALPATFRDEAEAAASAVVVDPTAWGATRPIVRPDLLPELERAVIERRQVVLGYRDRSDQSTERTVHPLGLVSKGNVWYLLAHTEAGLRTFRIGRVRSAVVTDLPAVRPADFDLADAWRSVVAHVRELRTQTRVSVRLDHRHVWPLRAQFGDDLSLIELAGDRDDADDRVTAIIGGPSVERIAEHLAGWGAAIEVLDPPAVREHLVTIARQLLARYAAPE
jgi:predicted DNA-binding transcriptional regulator YafY